MTEKEIYEALVWGGGLELYSEDEVRNSVRTILCEQNEYSVGDKQDDEQRVRRQLATTLKAYKYLLDDAKIIQRK